jgi:hypothetical protein
VLLPLQENCEVSADGNGHQTETHPSSQTGAFDMKKLSIATVIVAVATTAVLASANRCVASAKDAQKQPSVIALVDLGEILKNDPARKQKMSAMKADVQSATDEIKKEKTKLEERIAKDGSALRLKIGLQKRNFVQREAQLLLTVYEQATEQIDEYARTHDVDVVLNFTSKLPDSQNPQAIIRHINRQIVWQDN